jgi:hypothetical protein
MAERFTLRVNGRAHEVTAEPKTPFLKFDETPAIEVVALDQPGAPGNALRGRPWLRSRTRSTTRSASASGICRSRRSGLRRRWSSDRSWAAYGAGLKPEALITGPHFS